MLEEKRLIIGKTIGDPIDPNLKVSVPISEIADVSFAEPGEEVKTYSNLRSDVDSIITIAADGKITTTKKTVLNAAKLTFVGLQSSLQYVLATDVLANTDLRAIANCKISIARGMDKTELKRILDAIIAAGACSTISIPSSGDLYDTILDAKHAVEDYGDNYVLLCGSNVMNAIDEYDKKKSASLYYNPKIREMMSNAGIKPIKIFGKVDNTSVDPNVDNSAVILDKNKFILVSRDSLLGDRGKPIAFCRRVLSGDFASLMGIEVDELQRGLDIAKMPIPDGAGANILGYGVYGFESIIEAILNPKGIVKSESLTSIL